MKFIQRDDGSCHIFFSDNERKTIKEKGFIYLSDEMLKHFGNNLVKVVVDWNVNFNEKIKKLQTTDNEVLTYSDKKDESTGN